MIDIEPILLREFQADLQSEYGKPVVVLNDRTLRPPSFPVAFLEETESAANASTSDSGGNENHANVMYRLTVTSEKANGKKAEAKAIFSVGDSILSRYGLRRLSRQATDMNSATKYSLTGRYGGIVDKNNTIIGGYKFNGS